MSDAQDDFDPNEVFKRWAARGAAERNEQALDDDATRARDGWSIHSKAAAPAKRHWAPGEVIDLPHLDVAATRAADAADPGPLGAEAAAAARALLLGAEDVAVTDLPVVVRRAVNPRLLASWQPGVWTGAVRPVCEATTEFVQTPQGPVVETYPPHMLLALWPPQSLAAPLLARWPLRVMLSGAEAERASDELLALMPPDAKLWLPPIDVDWALVAELVLHHDAGLRPFQLTALRRFAAAEREASFTRLNQSYGRAEGGTTIEQRQDG